jgi:hypothetical protein
LATSVLTNVKKLVGLAEADTSFDLDIVTHINSIFSVLTQLGIGPADGFMIEDATPTWEDFLGGDSKTLNAVKTYMYLRVRLLFDPPSTSFVIESLNKQIEELEVRMSIVREGDSWVDPMPATVTSSTIWCD